MFEIKSFGVPSPWVVSFAPLIPSQGQVLDLACGNGRHAFWLANQGYHVEALDRDPEALANLEGLMNIKTRQIDLENGNDLSWTERKFDGVIVSRYLYRPIIKTIPSILKPGGVLIYETFMIGNERYGRPSNPDFLLLENELLDAYSPLLEIIQFNQGYENSPKPAMVQRICARRALS